MAIDTHKNLFEADYPVIMAPMFLVSNAAMVVAASDNGISGTFPALNYRTDKEFRAAIDNIRAHSSKPFGVNLIVNKSNVKYKTQLDTCIEKKIDYIITSLGNPKECIDRCKPLGIKVFCDVIDLKYALKVQELGADAVIAVNSVAGGHAGNITPEELIPMLKKELSIPIISAGGVSNSDDIKRMIDLGASAVSVGTIFIASEEAGVSDDYKNALVQYGEKDIVRTTKMSGSALTVINTPYVQTIGTEASFLEKLMHRNKWLKKYIKMFIAVRGLNKISNAANKATYKTVWVAGPTIESIKAVEPLSVIIKRLVSGL